MSAREEVLLLGLVDWIALSSIHGTVEEESPGDPLAVVQDKVLDLIRSLVTEGLFELGDLATPNHRFDDDIVARSGSSTLLFNKNYVFDHPAFGGLSRPENIVAVSRPHAPTSYHEVPAAAYR